MKKYYIILVLVVALVGNMVAITNNAGEKGFQILEVNPSPSMSAMGDAGSLVTNDALNFFNNPVAGLYNNRKAVTVSQNFWIFDTDFFSGGFSHKRNKDHWGVGFRYLDYGSIDERDETGNIIGEFAPLDFVATLNYGRNLGATHHIGINVNYLYEKIQTASAIGLAFDLGYAWDLPLKDTKTYAAIKNIGFTSKMENEKIDLPVAYEIGLNKSIVSRNYILDIDAKLLKSNDTDLAANFGTQIKVLEIFHVRAGYKFNNDINDYSFGFGVDYGHFNIDYAYLLMNDNIDDVHKVSLSYHF